MHCRPRLYVYRLPESYRDPSENTNGMPADGIGRPLRVHAEGLAGSVWDAEQYSVASLVHERALSWRCRTHDPMHADLFFVPAFKPRLGTTQSCAESGDHRNLVTRLRLELPNSSKPANFGSTNPLTTLEARGGADHIVLNPRSGMSWERFPYCELGLGSPSLGAALYLAMEQAPRNGSWVYPEGYCGKVCVDAYRPQLLSEGWYWSIPWTSTVHLDTRSSPTPPWAAINTRRFLVAAHFGTYHKPVLPKPTLQLRERLIEQCKAQPFKCSYSLPKSPERTALLYWEATFCLQPGGDTITRKGILDALLLGCIPVLFHDGQRSQWGWHWGAWVQSATLTLNQSAVRHGKLNVIDHLAALPESKVHALRQAIRKHAHRMHYSAVDTSTLPSGLKGWASPDAFEVVLEGAWRLARDSRLQQAGRHLQRTRKGGSEVTQRRNKLAAAVGSDDDSGGDLDGFVLNGADKERRRKLREQAQAVVELRVARAGSDDDDLG